jgi:hypothetical protein
MARVLPTRRWLLVELARVRSWLDVESARTRRWLLVELAWLHVGSTRAKNWFLVESARKKRRLLVELARAKLVWPDIKSTPEFWIALLLFLVFIVGIGVLGLASKFR